MLRTWWNGWVTRRRYAAAGLGGCTIHAFAGVGIAHQMLGNQSEADRYYARAFELDPSLRP